MVRSALADALLGHDATEELRHVLLVDRRAVLSGRLDVDHERGPVRTREQRDRRRARRERVAGLDRTMDDDVVLVVERRAFRASSEATDREAGAIVSQTGTMAKTGPPGTSSVAAA